MPGNHLARIYDWLGVETRTAAARIALTVPWAGHRRGAARWPSSWLLSELWIRRAARRVRAGGPGSEDRRPCYAAGLRAHRPLTKGGHMAVKLYVGGLSYSTTSEALREHFVQCGTVESATVITDRYSGQSRGFGFVEMATNEEAQKAVSMLNGQRLDGRTIKVELANPQGAGGGGGGRGGGGMGGGRGGSGRPPRW
jgi:cold-inducible RNA-binding protein